MCSFVGQLVKLRRVANPPQATSLPHMQVADLVPKVAPDSDAIVLNNR